MQIDRIETNTGAMIPIYKDIEKFWNDYDLKFVYASVASPGSIKGPHLHKKRECRLVVISGKLKVVVQENDNYKEYILDSKIPKIITIEPGKPFAVFNETDEESIILNFANHCWTPDDQDNHKPENWDYN